jgi:hypothetical protein
MAILQDYCEQGLASPSWIDGDVGRHMPPRPQQAVFIIAAAITEVCNVIEAHVLEEPNVAMRRGR